MNDTVRDLLRGLPSRLKGPWVFPIETGETPLDPKELHEPRLRPSRPPSCAPNFRWHDLRHTFASRLVMAGVDLRTVQELMGHKTIAMTLRYSHLSPAHQPDAVQRIARERTGTSTGTDARGSRAAVGAARQVGAEAADSRAGDRGRTGDVQLGKLEACARKIPGPS
jgi:hypothetical protein